MKPEVRRLIESRARQRAPSGNKKLQYLPRVWLLHSLFDVSVYRLDAEFIVPVAGAGMAEHCQFGIFLGLDTCIHDCLALVS